jgi:hypothetical protein
VLRGRFAALLAGARTSLAFGSLRGRFAALLAGARTSLAFGSLRGLACGGPALCRGPRKHPP